MYGVRVEQCASDSDVSSTSCYPGPTVPRPCTPYLHLDGLATGLLRLWIKGSNNDDMMFQRYAPEAPSIVARSAARYVST